MISFTIFDRATRVFVLLILAPKQSSINYGPREGVSYAASISCANNSLLRSRCAESESCYRFCNDDFRSLVIPARVKTQICPKCSGQYIKTVSPTTGKCFSCFPCPPCEDGYTSSVPCGTTVPVGTDIKCVPIQSDPVALCTGLPLATSSSFIISPTTSIVHSTASSSASNRSSSRSDTTKKQKSEKELALAEWKKDSSIYIFSGVVLAVILVVIIIVYRISRRKCRQQLSLQSGDSNTPIHPLLDVLPQDTDTCSINVATDTAVFRRPSEYTSEIGDGNQRPQCIAVQSSPEGNSKPSDLVAAPVNDAQLHNPSLTFAPLSQSLNVRDGAIADNMEQQRSINWSALSQSQKYNTKVLEMPFPLLLKICITLDIQRVDGNDVRMLAYKLGISVPGELALLKQAASTQPPDNNYFSNSTSYVVLSTKSSLAVRGFVSIMEEIERDDIIHLINNWSS